MDRELDYLTALLLNPFLTATEAAQEAAATLAVTRSSSSSRERWPADSGSRRPAPVLDF